MNLRYRKISLTDALNLMLQPNWFISPPAFNWELLRENSLIHAKLGFEKIDSETLYYKTQKWEISFNPDKINGDTVIECKILRPYSKKAELMEYAFHQANLEAYFLNLPKIKIVLYDYKEQKITDEIEQNANYDVAESMLNAIIIKLEKLRNIFIKNDTSEMA